MTRTHRRPARRRDLLEAALVAFGWFVVFTLPIYIEALVELILA